jgi:RHS repeat-associated protein
MIEELETIYASGTFGDAVVRDGEVYTPTYDANGNISEYMDSSGTIITHQEYDPFGNAVVSTGDAPAFTHWFSTKPWCVVTGMVEYQFRKYRPGMGRWMSRDVIQGNNNYRFVNNDACCSIDLYGLHRMLTGALAQRPGTPEIDGYPQARNLLRLLDKLKLRTDANAKPCFDIVIKDFATTSLDEMKKDVEAYSEDVYFVAHGGLYVNGELWTNNEYYWNQTDVVEEGLFRARNGEFISLDSLGTGLNPNNVYGCFVAPAVRKRQIMMPKGGHAVKSWTDTYQHMFRQLQDRFLRYLNDPCEQCHTRKIIVYEGERQRLSVDGVLDPRKNASTTHMLRHLPVKEESYYSNYYQEIME